MSLFLTSITQVVLARQNATNIPYAIKILDQAHLIQQKKTKYAKIERDALVRLGPQIRTNGNRGSTMSIMSNSTVTGHRRRGSGASGSSAGGSGSGTFLGAEAAKAGRRRGSNDTGSWGTASFTERGNAFLRQQATGNGDASGSPSIPPIPIREGRPDSQITVRNDNSPPLGSDGTSPSDKPDLSRLTIPTSPRMGANSNGMASLSSSQSTITYSPTETIARRSGESERQEVLGKPPVARKRKRASHPGVIKLHYTFKDHTSLCELPLVYWLRACV
jgi:3-phosphoinositide dependent protein kinase-1